MPKLTPIKSVFVTYNLNDDSLKKDQASIGTLFSRYKSMDYLSDNGRNSNPSMILCMPFLHAVFFK